MEHEMYTGKHYKGNLYVPFGKCRCGAYLLGQEQIDEHRALVDGAGKNFGEGR